MPAQPLVEVDFTEIANRQIGNWGLLFAFSADKSDKIAFETVRGGKPASHVLLLSEPEITTALALVDNAMEVCNVMPPKLDETGSAWLAREDDGSLGIAAQLRDGAVYAVLARPDGVEQFWVPLPYLKSIRGLLLEGRSTLRRANNGRKLH